MLLSLLLEASLEGSSVLITCMINKYLQHFIVYYLHGDKNEKSKQKDLVDKQKHYINVLITRLSGCVHFSLVFIIYYNDFRLLTFIFILFLLG